MVNPMKTVTKVRAGSPLLYGLAVAAIWLGAGALLLSLTLRFTGMQEANLPLIAQITHAVAALAGGFACGRKAGRKGWHYGGTLGIVYALIIVSIGFLAADAPLSKDTWMLFAFAVPAGAFGGMFGVGTGR
ncbi:hypothetical protein BG53_09040 [Paenibacillus darwinianus]|uniref:TIGR04086 family membrane protein n=1 Tax=Paenibacillus darwinianus TaxID=1380763 RepID=A0A9W5RYJ8_9BACL|nr:TIGR04086 family membrane protein [Paenibacillus darwinianus]EXX85259.1 hypothetical protein BG53_09040 [Paenibacillus darwinianus]EXX88510.1 hypothetical protein CH50_03160 [Paenibacillus darwinianus]EXX88798.1 hypothetical protein BG52_01285 [Paenibacillus darwinianus]